MFGDHWGCFTPKKTPKNWHVQLQNSSMASFLNGIPESRNQLDRSELLMVFFPTALRMWSGYCCVNSLLKLTWWSCFEPIFFATASTRWPTTSQHPKKIRGRCVFSNLSIDVFKFMGNRHQWRLKKRKRKKKIQKNTHPSTSRGGHWETS